MNDETEKPILVIEARIADFERNFKTALRNAINGVLSEIAEELHQFVTVEAKSE